MTVIVIGVDPGDSTGVAIIKDTTLWHAFQGTPEDALTLVELTITRFQSDAKVTVAAERYVNMQSRGRRSHQPTAQRVVGALEHMVTRLNFCRFVLQGPADAWAIASNQRLRQLGMYQTNVMLDTPDTDDANMAVRHALLYLSHAHATLFHDILRQHGVTS